MMFYNNTTVNGTLISQPESDKCVLSKDLTAEPLRVVFKYLLLTILPIVMLENIFVTLAVLLYRAKLKHNIIYLYVASGLFANVIYCLFSFYHYLNQAVGFQDDTAVYLWAFQRGNVFIFFHMI